MAHWLSFVVVFCLMGTWHSVVAMDHEQSAEGAAIEQEEGESKLSAFFYVGQFSDTRFNQIVRFDTDFQRSWVAVIGITRELFAVGPGLRMEGEVQFGQHFGRQHHQEINAVLTTRWVQFPWNEHLPTSAAFGMGFSYAFERPPLEESRERHPTFLLVYLLLELEVAHPNQPDWSGFARIHHRSGAFGVFSEARGSNFVGLGLRRRF